MKTNAPIQRPGTGTRLFGVFTVIHDHNRQTVRLRLNFKRLLGVLAIAGFSLYLMGVAAGYVWLHNLRKLDEITVWDVAFFNVAEVRGKTGRKQFVTAKAAWKNGKYQEAYIAYFTGLRNAPGHLAGRLEAADFLIAVGTTNQAVTVLEEGIQRQPGDETLVRRTLDLLTTTGRDQEALKLLRGPLAGESLNQTLMRTYEVQAVFNTEGGKAAKQLLEKYPEVRRAVASAPVVARVLWESQERLGAIDLLANYLKTAPKDYAAYARLVEFQEAAGNLSDAQEIAGRACQNLPGDFAPRILKIATLTNDARAWKAAVDDYLKEFRERPEAVAFLAEVAGKKGWAPLAGAIYQNMANRSSDARMYALFYADALFQNNRRREAMDTLLAVDRQTADGDYFMTALLHREMIVASSLGLHEELIAYGQKLANLISREPERLETLRRLFERMGLKEAAAALSGGKAKAKPAVARG